MMRSSYRNRKANSYNEKVKDGKYLTRIVETVVDEFAALAAEVDLICFADDNTLQGTGRAWRHDRRPRGSAAFLRIYALRLYFKVRRRYRIEPLVQMERSGPGEGSLH